MNTELRIKYRDAEGGKQHSSVIVAGEITSEHIERLSKSLVEDGKFIAREVGLPTPSEQLAGNGEYPSEETDHVYSFIAGFESNYLLTDPKAYHVDLPVTDSRTIEEIVTAIEASKKDEMTEWEYLIATFYDADSASPK